MTSKKKSSTPISGISVGLAFAALGFSYAFWLNDVYGSATGIIAGILILFGAAGLLVEAQKVLTGSKIRMDNGGVGLLLLVPAAFGAYFANINLEGLLRGGVILLLSIVALFGFAGLIDALVSIVENNKTQKSITVRLIDAFKFLALLASSVATIIVAIRQIT